MTKDEDCLSEIESFEFKIGLAEMLSGGVIVDVSNPEQAKIAEDAGASAVTVSQVRTKECLDTVLRMSHPEMIQKIQAEITLPIISKCRIGHFAEAQILESLFVDFIDENESLTPVDDMHYIDKHRFRIPFICGSHDLGQALRRIAEGAALIRTEVGQGVGTLAHAIRSLRTISSGLRNITSMDHAELLAEATRINAPYDLLKQVAALGQLPVPICASGGIVTPADAALMIQLGAKSVFVDADIFDCEDPLSSVKAIVGAVNHYSDPEVLTKATLGKVGEITTKIQRPIRKDEILATRGW